MINPVKLAGNAIEWMWNSAGRTINWLWDQAWSDPLWKLTSSANFFLWANLLMGVNFKNTPEQPAPDPQDLTYYPGYLYLFCLSACAYPLIFVGMLLDNAIVAIGKIVQRGFQVAGYGKGKSWLDWNVSLDPFQEQRTDSPFRFFSQCGFVLGAIPGVLIGLAAVAAYHVAAFSVALPLSIVAFSIGIATPIINFFAKCAATCMIASFAAVGITATAVPVGAGTFIAGLVSYGWNSLKSLAACVIPGSSSSNTSPTPASSTANATPPSPTSVALMRTFNNNSVSPNNTADANLSARASAPRTIQYEPLPRVNAVAVATPSLPSRDVSQPVNNSIVLNEKRM